MIAQYTPTAQQRDSDIRDSESTRHPVFLPVEDWNLPGVKRMVVEMQLHLKVRFLFPPWPAPALFG